MSLILNTNISSLNTQNNLSKSGSALSQATERLSSGLKINSAADNAAGFAIAQSYTTQIGGLQQASANASDAINLAQTAGSALDQVSSNLEAIRDLATQATNGTLTDDNRKALDQEVQQRLAEITRIANQTTFNGRKVLDGSLSTQSFQVGADVGQTISVSLGTSAKASDLGKDVGEIDTGSLSGAFVSSGAAGEATTVNLSAITISVSGATGAISGGIKISEDSTATASSVQDLADAINANSKLTDAGISAAVDGNGGLSIFHTGAGGLVIDDSGSVSADSKLGNGAAAAISGSATFAGSTDGGATFTSGTYDGTAVDGGGSLAQGNVKTVDAANTLLNRIDSALTTVSNFQAQLGAVQNRFQSTISTLSAQTTNLQSSLSTIQDADFAAETANLSQAQVLQQAGISVLAQANAQPQQILKLLQ